MPGGEQAGEDKELTDEIARRSAEKPGQTEFHPVGEEGTFGMRFEDMAVVPQDKRTEHPGVGEEVRAFHRLPPPSPAQGERPLAHGKGELRAGLCDLAGADFKDAHPGRGNVPQVVRILVKKKKFFHRGRQQGRAGEDGHAAG